MGLHHYQDATCYFNFFDAVRYKLRFGTMLIFPQVFVVQLWVVDIHSHTILALNIPGRNFDEISPRLLGNSYFFNLPEQSWSQLSAICGLVTFTLIRPEPGSFNLFYRFFQGSWRYLTFLRYLGHFLTFPRVLLGQLCGASARPLLAV